MKQPQISFYLLERDIWSEEMSLLRDSEMISSIVTSVVKDSLIFWGPFKLYKRVSFLNVLIFKGENAFNLY